MPVKNGNEVRVEKVLNSAPKAVFQALAEGRLFSNCGADGEKLVIDFRVGGGYRSYFANAEVTCCGKFLEIIPEKKIVFTWGDEGSDEGFPMTRVQVELLSEAGGSKTKLLIHHTGFTSQDEAEAHDSGWNAGLTDLEGELVDGKIRILRMFSISRDALFSACNDPQKFSALGEKVSFGEVVPGQKIVFNQPSRVTLSFDEEDEGGSSLALVHEGLPLGDALKKQRKSWESFMTQLRAHLK